MMLLIYSLLRVSIWWRKLEENPCFHSNISVISVLPILSSLLHDASVEMYLKCSTM